VKKNACLLIVVIVFVTGLFIQISKANNTDEINISKTLSNTVSQNRNSITGFVFNESRGPVSDVYVELLNDLYVTISRTKTTGSGLFSFRGLQDGNYKIKILPYNLGYEEQTRDVSLISVSAVAGSGSTSEQVDFYLKAKKNISLGPLAAPGVVFVQEVPKNAQKAFEDGVNFLREKKEREGFEKLKNAIEIFPEYFLALDLLGTEYAVRGYYEAAFVLLTKAVEINPRSFSSTFGLGLSQFRLGQADKAIENLLRATELYGESANSYLWLGIAYHNTGKLNEALNALLKANKLSKGEAAEVHWQLARVYKDQKLYTKAADELELFLKYKSDASNKEEVKKTIQVLRQKEITK
jgi:tetratricopeptide (TPR) repeat protein